MKSLFLAAMLAFIAMLASPVARADLYAAEAAAKAKDFARAFELFRELAELGNTYAQENIAVMYVNGEGVTRDNVLGYAWAVMAKEGGGGEAASGIVAQLEPHLNAAARARVAELQSRFGKAALQERLLPKSYIPGTVGKRPCGIRGPADPDDFVTDGPKREGISNSILVTAVLPRIDRAESGGGNPKAFYPVEAKRQRISGSVLVEAMVAPDGLARNVRASYSLPAGVFDEAARRVAMITAFTAPVENGVTVACTIRFKVSFSIRDVDKVEESPEQQKVLSDTRVKAEAGDPRSQLNYGLLLEMRSELDVDQLRSMEWFLKAAQGGLPTAQYLVGRQLLSDAEARLEANDSKGMAWLQMAADASQAEAQTLLANNLLRKNRGDPAGKAQDLLDKAAASGHRDGKFHLAGLLATGSDAARRDPRRALELLEQLKVELDFDPAFFEVRAAAHAMLGDFAEAREDQTMALRKAKKLGWNTQELQARQASYAASKTWTGDLFAY